MLGDFELIIGDRLSVKGCQLDCQVIIMQVERMMRIEISSNWKSEGESLEPITYCSYFNT